MYRIYLITVAWRYYELVNLAPIIYGDNNNTWYDRQKLGDSEHFTGWFKCRCRCYYNIEDLTHSQTASGSESTPLLLHSNDLFTCLIQFLQGAQFNEKRAALAWAGRSLQLCSFWHASAEHIKSILYLLQWYAFYAWTSFGRYN